MKKKPGKKKWTVYIVRCRNGALYTGITNDLPKRIKTHNSGKGALYTKFFGPVRLVYQEPARNVSFALKREYAIKQWPRAAKLKLIKKRNMALLKKRNILKAKHFK